MKREDKFTKTTSSEAEDNVLFFLGKTKDETRTCIVREYWPDLEVWAASIRASFELPHFDQAAILEAAIEGLLKAIDTFSPEKGSARKWAFKLIHRKAIRRANRLKRRRNFEKNMVQAFRTDKEMEIALPYLQGQDEEEITLDRLACEIDTALRALSPMQRRLLYLRYYTGLSEAKIADQLNCPLSIVKSHIQQGLAILYARLVQAN